jgi:hypothetical protein
MGEVRGGLRSKSAGGRATTVTFVARAAVAVVILAGACAKRSLSTDSAAGIAGLGGSAGGPIGDAAGQGGQAPAGAGGDGQGGQAPTGTAGAGQGGVGGPDAGGPDGAAGRSIPAGILASLAITDATIDEASGADLFDLARQIGYARGYAVCVCTPGAPAWTPDGLDQCALAETTFNALLPPMEARCILDRSRSIPGFDDYLRCRIKVVRASGQYEASCVTGMNLIPPPPVPACTAPDSTQNLLYGNTCQAAFYCADGTFAMTGRCDYKLDCADGADERGCGFILCGDKVVDPTDACTATVCSASFTPPICVPGDPSGFDCGDGTKTSSLLACDGTNDCANGRDEALCF